MTTYQVAHNPTLKKVKIQPDGVAVGTGYTDIGSFDHDDNDPDDELGADSSHVYFHHVKDLLHAQDVYDLQLRSIYIPVDTITSLPATPSISLAGEATAQITNTFTPPIARDQRVTYASDNELVATVDADGLVTPVGTGTCTITVTAVDGFGATDTVAVTVTA